MATCDSFPLYILKADHTTLIFVYCVLTHSIYYSIPLTSWVNEVTYLKVVLRSSDSRVTRWVSQTAALQYFKQWRHNCNRSLCNGMPWLINFQLQVQTLNKKRDSFEALVASYLPTVSPFLIWKHTRVLLKKMWRKIIAIQEAGARDFLLYVMYVAEQWSGPYSIPASSFFFLP